MEPSTGSSMASYLSVPTTNFFEARESPAGFKLFPKLPAELRIMIWEYCFTLQVISILHDSKDYKYFKEVYAPVPLRGFNRESRLIACEYYTLHLRAQKRSPTFLFSCALDTLWYRAEIHTLHREWRLEIDKIRHLALSYSRRSREPTAEELKEIFQKMPSLREITIIPFRNPREESQVYTSNTIRNLLNSENIERFLGEELRSVLVQVHKELRKVDPNWGALICRIGKPEGKIVTSTSTLELDPNFGSEPSSSWARKTRNSLTQLSRAKRSK